MIPIVLSQSLWMSSVGVHQQPEQFKYLA